VIVHEVTQDDRSLGGMHFDLLFFLIFLGVFTYGYGAHVYSRWFPPAWIEVLADFEVLLTMPGRSKLLYGTHLFRVKYEVAGERYVKLVPVRYHRKTLELEVLPQPQMHLEASKLLLRVHPDKPTIIEYQKWPWWHDALAVSVLVMLWGCTIYILRREGVLAS